MPSWLHEQAVEIREWRSRRHIGRRTLDIDDFARLVQSLYQQPHHIFHLHHAHPNHGGRHFAVKHVIKLNIDQARDHAFSKLAVELWRLGARCYIEEEIFADHIFRTKARQCGFGHVVFKNIAQQIEFHHAKWQVVANAAGEAVDDVV